MKKYPPSHYRRLERRAADRRAAKTVAAGFVATAATWMHGIDLGHDAAAMAILNLYKADGPYVPVEPEVPEEIGTSIFEIASGCNEGKYDSDPTQA